MSDEAWERTQDAVSQAAFGRLVAAFPTAARPGAVRREANYRDASEAVTGATSGWTGADLLALHVAMKRLGQKLCRPDAPACAVCPLATDCRFAARRSRRAARSGVIV